MFRRLVPDHRRLVQVTGVAGVLAGVLVAAILYLLVPLANALGSPQVYLTVRITNALFLVALLLSILLYAALGAAMRDRRLGVFMGTAIAASAVWSFSLGAVILGGPMLLVFLPPPFFPFTWSAVNLLVLFVSLAAMSVGLYVRGRKIIGVAGTLCGIVGVATMVERTLWPYYLRWGPPGLAVLHGVSWSPFFEAWLVMMGAVVLRAGLLSD